MIVQITPPAINNIGWRTYIIFAVLNTLWLPIIYFFFPETKGWSERCEASWILANNLSGLELEDVDRLFKKDDGVVDALYDGKAVQEQVEAKDVDIA